MSDLNSSEQLRHVMVRAAAAECREDIDSRLDKRRPYRPEPLQHMRL